jgi:hypothetical protein
MLLPKELTITILIKTITFWTFEFLELYLSNTVIELLEPCGTGEKQKLV